MIKLITSNQSLFLKSTGNRFLRRVLLFNPFKLDEINSDELFSTAIESMRFRNGTFKTTKKNRFEGVDDKVVDLLRNENLKVIRILDVGVSDASTTSSLSDTLSVNGIKHQIVATDLYGKILVEKHLFHTNFFDEDHEWIFTTLGSIYFSPGLSNWFFFSALGARVFKKSQLGKTSKEIYLINPSAREKVKNGSIEFIRHNVFTPLPDKMENKFDFIRCMNILNPKYFSIDNLRKGVGNLIYTLNDFGIIQVGKSENLNNIHNVSFFQKKNGNMVLVKKINEGSEIASLFIEK